MPSLPDLPTELLMEIIKYVEPVQWYRYRDIRRALSQTCRTLRPIFLGSFWSAATVAFRTETVERQLSRVQKLPYLLPYIRSLSVSMEGCTMESWQLIAQLLRVLQLLSHLQTLAIERFPHTMIDVLAISCHRIVFPSILILALPAELSPILHCFPNVHTLTPLTHSLVTVAAQCCEHIHTVNLINTAADCKYAEGYRRVTKCSCLRCIKVD
ncbi:hypothetical protein B0H19DRAFT_568511 [Mycena capillaripes]|nr:hypothetical protein B0H19DRAFT_568511 [Mycena capillaripes]